MRIDTDHADSLTKVDIATNRGGKTRTVPGPRPLYRIESTGDDAKDARDMQDRLERIRSAKVEKNAVCGRILPGIVRQRADGKFEEYHATKGWRINRRLGKAAKI